MRLAAHVQYVLKMFFRKVLRSKDPVRKTFNSNVLAVFQKVTNKIGPRGCGIKPHRGQGIFIREDWFPRVPRLHLSSTFSESFPSPSASPLLTPNVLPISTTQCPSTLLSLFLSLAYCS